MQIDFYWQNENWCIRQNLDPLMDRQMCVEYHSSRFCLQSMRLCVLLVECNVVCGVVVKCEKAYPNQPTDYITLNIHYHHSPVLLCLSSLVCHLSTFSSFHLIKFLATNVIFTFTIHSSCIAFLMCIFMTLEILSLIVWPLPTLWIRVCRTVAVSFMCWFISYSNFWKISKAFRILHFLLNWDLEFQIYDIHLCHSNDESEKNWAYMNISQKLKQFCNWSGYIMMVSAFVTFATAILARS